MKAMKTEIQAYLNKMLGLEADIADNVVTKGSLAPYLAKQYDFYKLTISEREFLLVAYSGEEIQNPSVVRNHLRAIAAKTGLVPIYSCDGLSGDARRDLIRYKVPFVIPAKQLYLPDLGIDLKEQLATQRKKKEKLSPITQVFVLKTLLGKDYRSWTVSGIKGWLGCSIASASRAVDELEQFNVMRSIRTGKERHSNWKIKGIELWKTLTGKLTDPIRKTAYATINETAIQVVRQAGLSALAHYSRIAEPGTPVYACGNKHFLELKKAGDIKLLEYPRVDAIELQVWNYDPIALDKGDYVDPLSLYLGLQDDPDDRTQICLDEMLGEFSW